MPSYHEGLRTAARGNEQWVFPPSCLTPASAAATERLGRVVKTGTVVPASALRETIQAFRKADRASAGRADDGTRPEEADWRLHYDHSAALSSMLQ